MVKVLRKVQAFEMAYGQDSHSERPRTPALGEAPTIRFEAARAPTSDAMGQNLGCLKGLRYIKVVLVHMGILAAQELWYLGPVCIWHASIRKSPVIRYKVGCLCSGEINAVYRSLLAVEVKRFAFLLRMDTLSPVSRAYGRHADTSY